MNCDKSYKPISLRSILLKAPADQQVSDLLLNKIDLSLLVITKSAPHQVFCPWQVSWERGPCRGLFCQAGPCGTSRAYAEVWFSEQFWISPGPRRDPTTAPGSGDRVPYVIVTGSKGAKVGRCLIFNCVWGRHTNAAKIHCLPLSFSAPERSFWLVRNNKSVDAQYYIEHQLQLPLLRIFGPIMGGSTRCFHL